MKNIKTAFANAVAKYPERERRVALAAFVARYSQDWPVTDYRCVGLDADVIKEFLGGCGLRPDVDYKDVVSFLDPEAHQLKWVNSKSIVDMVALLSSMLSSESGRTRLYVAQIDSDQSDPAPGLTDDVAGAPGCDTASPATGEPRFWDPLKLYDHTMALARAAELLEGRPKQWARAWYAKPEKAREIMAPLWVIEACTPEEKRLGLFMPTSRSSEGSTASIPFVLGRYTRRDENLFPAFPTLASEPVATLWGREPLHTRVCPLEGYVSVTVADLTGIPKTDPARDTWTQVESAYVDIGSITKLDQVAALVRPEKLWRYIAELYETAYGHRVALMSDLCRVHSGMAHNEDEAAQPTASTFDESVKEGNGKIEIRPAFVMVDEPPVPGASHGEAHVAAGSPNFVSLPGDETVQPGETDPDKHYVNGTRDMASEWYLMTHCNTGSPCFPVFAQRQNGGDARTMDIFRQWTDATPETVAKPGDALVPRDINVGRCYCDGYNAVRYVTYSLIRHFRDTSMETWADMMAVSRDGWDATHPTINGVLAPVMAIWSGVLGDGSPVPCLLRSSPSPSDVTDALSVLARPDVQLAMPAKPEEVQIVVETNLRFSALRADETLWSSMEHACREAFLWGFQANEPRHRVYTIQARGYRCEALEAMMDELAGLGTPVWPLLWNDRFNLAEADYDYEDHTESNSHDFRVELMPDKFDRLVMVFGLRAGSPADSVCRATFRYFTGLPMVPAESMRAVFKESRSRWITVEPQTDPSLAAKRILVAHLHNPGASVVAGWTDWRSAWARENLTGHIVPERSDYKSAPLSMPTPQAVARAAVTVAGRPEPQNA